jgi:transposase
MGEDISERLDIVPAQFRVIVTRRPKYACRACEEVVVQTDPPPLSWSTLKYVFWQTGGPRC